MFTTLFFFLLLIYVLFGGNTGEALKLGCFWLLACFIAEVLLWCLVFGCFGIAFLGVF